ncbi:Mn superoxide dismutase [Fistulina hepatica ATCC 64428]|uniref:Superoxide dismutase n=1 Tax=Fistulina hepatica ATCC 64428 TaxID=1128425 RepID=A0A0D7AEE1_9AGAR|nr:Mn superoxide dismutase [Fistulina hepatica ATCC 64428]
MALLAFSCASARNVLSRSLMTRAAAIHTLPELPYAYDALEPFISKDIMQLHHSKHHQTYVNGLNATEKALAEAPTLTEQLALQSALKFNGGGHINHSLFWKNLAPSNGDGGKLSNGALKKMIERDFDTVEAFIKAFNTKTAAIQGSGWGWLGYNTTAKKLEIVSTANQDPLLSYHPIIGVDVWEHAFYLQYKNVKVDYLNAIWNVVNWKEAEARLQDIL